MASGDSLVAFMAIDNQATSSAAATIDARGASDEHLVLDFDDSSDEEAIFSAVLPQHYAGGGIDIIITWGMSSATSGNVILTAAIERIGTSQDIDSDSFATAQTSSAQSVPGTSGQLKTTTLGMTSGAQMDSLAVGEAFRLKITRDANNASDTATGDLELYAVEIRES